MGLTGARLVSVPSSGPAGRYYRQLTRMSTAFALTSDMAMLLLGGALKRRESISARLGDVLSYLYLASASLKRFKDQGSSPEDLPFLQWACEYCLYNIQMRLGEIIRNFPNRPVAWLLRLLVFPTGTPYRGHSDQLNHQVAGLLLEPSKARDRLTSGIYLSSGPGEPMGVLEVALGKVIAAETVEKKLRKAVQTGALKAVEEEALLQEAVKAGVIDKKEADLVRSAEEARSEVIRVDDFPQDYWKKG
jgi:acyl-CoA dehydrogenase